MAELGLAIIGGVPAVLQIAKGLVKVADVYKELGQANEHIELFQVQTRAFSEAYVQVQDAILDARPYMSDEQQHSHSNYADSVVKLFDITLKNLEDVVDQVAPHIRNKQPKPPNTVILAFRWLLKRHTVTALRLTMETVKSDAILLISVTTCQNLRRRIHELENMSGYGFDLSELKDRLRHREKSVRSQKRLAKEATERMVVFFKTHTSLEVLSQQEVQFLRHVGSEIQKETEDIGRPGRRRRHRKTRSGDTGSTQQSPGLTELLRDFYPDTRQQSRLNIAARRQRDHARVYGPYTSSESPWNSSDPSDPPSALVSQNEEPDRFEEVSSNPDTWSLGAQDGWADSEDMLSWLQTQIALAKGTHNRSARPSGNLSGPGEGGNGCSHKDDSETTGRLPSENPGPSSAQRGLSEPSSSGAGQPSTADEGKSMWKSAMWKPLPPYDDEDLQRRRRQKSDRKGSDDGSDKESRKKKR